MGRYTVDWEKWFGSCRSLDDVKRQYKHLVMQHHPDLGGDTRTMQDINAAYDVAFELFKSRQNAAADADPEGRVRHTDEMPDDYRNVVEALLHMEGVTVELCGAWLWISGDTRPHKDELKALGCRWSSGKQMWYWRPAEEFRPWRRGKTSMMEIRDRYGSEMLQERHEANLATVA